MLVYLSDNIALTVQEYEENFGRRGDIFCFLSVNLIRIIISGDKLISKGIQFGASRKPFL